MNITLRTPTDHQLAILFRGLEQIHPDVAAALRASFAQQVATLDADSADYNALVADLINVLRGQFVSVMHADPRFQGVPFGAWEGQK